MVARCHIQVADYMEQGGGGANVLKLFTNLLWYIPMVRDHGVLFCLLEALLASANDVHRVGIEEHEHQDSVPPFVGVAPPVVYRANENRDVTCLASSALRSAQFVDPVEFPGAEPEQDTDAALLVKVVHMPRLLLTPLHDPDGSARVQADDVKCVA